MRNACPPGTSPSYSLRYPPCPAGYTNIAGKCWKGTESSGVLWPVNKICSENQEFDPAVSGLCYAKCNAGYKGAGPVCSQICTVQVPYDCGGECTIDKSTCDAHSATSKGSAGSAGAAAIDSCQ